MIWITRNKRIFDSTKLTKEEVKGNNKLETRNRKSNNKNRRQNKEKDLPKGLGAEKLELYSGREPKKV